MQNPQQTKLGKPSNYYRPLHRAAMKGDWKAAEEFLSRDPDAKTADITGYKDTVLHVAAWAGNEDFIKKLLKGPPPDGVLEERNASELTALDVAAAGGNLAIVKALTRNNSGLAQIMQKQEGSTSLFLAAFYAHEEVLRYLCSEIKKVNRNFLSTGSHSGSLTPALVRSGYYDILVSLMKDYPSVAAATINNSDEEDLLSVLAAKPADFHSGSSLSLWENCIYHLVPVDLSDECHMGENVDSHNESFNGQKNPILVACFTVLSPMYKLFWTALKHLIPRIKHIMEEKLKHKYIELLVHYVCKKIDEGDEKFVMDYFSKTEIMYRAVSSGIVEIVTICLQYFPNLLWIQMDGKYMVHAAIEQRREKIFNLISGRNAASMLLISNASEVSALHLVAGLAPPARLKSIPCSALQMQRELQWFKAIENIVPPFERDTKKSEGPTAGESSNNKHEPTTLAGESSNNKHEPTTLAGESSNNKHEPTTLAGESSNNKLPEESSTDKHQKLAKEPTAWELFTNQHENLAKEAEKWMRETSNSCMVVSTLIATVAFAAAFTVPGGNNSDKGIPIFLNNVLFAVFAISIALALFSSTTSILMFLSILTARYAEQDFLRALPKRLILGLASLFIAIAAMMVAFGSALQIMLSERWKWVYVPTMILGAIPVALFMMLQFPLFFQMVSSTFGPGIICPKRIW